MSMFGQHQPYHGGRSLAIESRRALHWYRLWIAVCTTGAIVHAILHVWLLGPLDPDPLQTMETLFWALVIIVLAAAMVGAPASRSLRNVRRVSGHRIETRSGLRRHSGAVLFLCAIAVGFLAGGLAHSITLDNEPSQAVTGHITTCDTGSKSAVCYAEWEAAGRTYQGVVPFGERDLGRRVQFEVSANRPDIVVTQNSTSSIVWLSIAVIAVSCWVWLRRTATLMTVLRAAASASH